MTPCRETGSGHWLAVIAAGRWQTNERAQLRLKMDGLYMGINIPEVERQKASKALNCDRQCPLCANSGQIATSHFAPVVCATSSKSGSFQLRLR